MPPNSPPVRHGNPCTSFGKSLDNIVNKTKVCQLVLTHPLFCSHLSNGLSMHAVLPLLPLVLIVNAPDRLNVVPLCVCLCSHLLKPFRTYSTGNEVLRLVANFYIPAVVHIQCKGRVLFMIKNKHSAA